MARVSHFSLSCMSRRLWFSSDKKNLFFKTIFLKAVELFLLKCLDKQYSL